LLVEPIEKSLEISPEITELRPMAEIAGTEVGFVTELDSGEEDRLYRQGAYDYAIGRRDTEAARYYVLYWIEESQIEGQRASVDQIKRAVALAIYSAL